MKAVLLFRLLRVKPIGAFQLVISSLSSRMRALVDEVLKIFVKTKEVARNLLSNVIHYLFGLSRILEMLYRHFLMAPRSSPRYFLRAREDPVGFLSELSKLGINYVVLRWAESIERADPSEDIDLLVADRDLEFVLNRLRTSSLKGQPFDIYSIAGCQGTGYQGKPYFPEYLSQAILTNAEVLGNGVRVPSALDERISLVYHLVFHKRYDTSVATTDEQNRIIKRILELSGEGNLPTILDRDLSRLHLKEMLPQLEECRMLVREIPGSPLAKILTRTVPTRTRVDRHILVFLCREALWSLGTSEKLEAILAQDGLFVDRKISLDPQQVKTIAKVSRGGNWNRGPFLRSGGRPKEIWIVWDTFAEADDEEVGFQTTKSLRRKDSWRAAILRQVSPFKNSNPFHTTDAIEESFEVFRSIGEASILQDSIDRASLELERSGGVKPESVIGKQFGRSRVWIQDVGSGSDPIVKKSFAIGAERFYEREVGFYSEFSQLDLTPALISAGERSINLPFLNPVGHCLSLSETIAVANFIREVNSRGRILVDFNPGNLARRPDGSLCAIDFEFVQPWPPGDIWWKSPDFEGIPTNAEVELPNGWTYGLDHWDIVWRDFTGHSLKQLRRLLN